MSEPITVRVTAAGQTVLSVSGELDILTTPTLAATVDAAIESGTTRLIFDLSDLEFIDSSGLHVLVHALRRLGQGCVTVVAGADNIVKVLAISGLDQIVPVYDSLDAASAEACRVGPENPIDDRKT